jgi:polypeptide N-acetylgalactosaminyltransferase
MSIVNEPISMILRTLHSILNRTPPPLLGEIIIVSTGMFETLYNGVDFLEKYTRSLPKVKYVSNILYIIDVNCFQWSVDEVTT